MSQRRLLLYIVISVLFFGCATYGPQYATNQNELGEATLSRKRTLEKTFYLIGDAGGAKPGATTDALAAFKKVIDTAQTKGDYAIFLGDNIYEKGLPKKSSPKRTEAEHKLQAQVDAVQSFEGKVLFIPGNHDWYSKGLEGLKRQEEWIEKALEDKNAFQPEKGCPIEEIDVSDDITLLLLDTQWYLANWDKHPTMNDECDIKTRKDFFLEIEGELKKNNEKTIIIAMHHPMYTNGVHGGKFAIEKHLFPTQMKVPLPGLASLVTQVRGQGGVSIQDRRNKRYSELMDRLATLAYDTNKAIFVSGHEHSLQYIDHDGLKQIVSGAGAKKSAAALGMDGLFAYGGQGFAILDVYTDGSSEVRYFSAKDGEPEELFKTQVHPPWKDYDISDLPTVFPSTLQASAYEKADTNKDKAYEKFWGKHYRKVYGTNIEVPVVTLDTFMGGFTVDRAGGGHQTRSLRLLSPQGKNYAMRAVKKSAVQFLQTVVFKESFVQESFRDTFTEDVILDFYTSSHPYASLAVGPLADAIGVYHTNPQLVWMPKHAALGKYNEAYGDELYIIEERPDEGFIDVPSFGTPDVIESTSDLLENLRKDEKYRVDESAYIRARLFDMLLGDWDRHADQWRWARFDKSDDERIYRPIPRDRDQVFSNYDGRFLNLIRTFIKASRQFQVYDGTLKDVKWINIAGTKLDHALLPNATKEDWLQEALCIEKELTDDVIDKAFLAFPKEVQTPQLDTIKGFLKQRRGHLKEIAEKYYKLLSKLVIIKGTDKDDHFEITREAQGTRVQVSRIKGGEVMKPFIDKLVRPEETNELWIYGLDDDDTFHISGKESKPIFTRVIGGQNNDVYTIEDGRRVKIYDHKTKPNTVVKKGGAQLKFSNIYTHNTYDINKIKTSVNQILPALGFNPDDGFRIGLQNVLTIKGFKNDPFYRKHILKAGYYTATSGFDLSYSGEFANSIGNWNLLVSARLTSDNYALNFFGFGNETENNQDTEPLELDYNRVKTGIADVSIGLVKDNDYGSRLGFTANLQRIEVDDTNERFITQMFVPRNVDFFDNKYFAGLEGMYQYHAADNDANPSAGMDFKLRVGAQMNLENTERTYGYVTPKLGFYNALTRNRKLVLKTLVQGQINIGDGFEFYQAATVGALNGLRGFRNQRFTGDSSFAGSADLRYSFKQTKTGLLPIQLGIYGGADTGRVWLDGENSDAWHSSYGGGFWINAVDVISGQLGLFASEDGLRFSFSFGARF